MTLKKRLSTPALDNEGRTYPVVLWFDDRDVSGWGVSPEAGQRMTGRWALSIEGTPGNWYLGELIRTWHPAVYLDPRTGWSIVNFHDVLSESLGVL